MLIKKQQNVMSLCLEIMTIVKNGQVRIVNFCIDRGGHTPLFFMPKNQLVKDELKVRILKLKDKLHKDHIRPEMDMKGLAHKYLNEVLDIIDEYRY